MDIELKINIQGGPKAAPFFYWVLGTGYGVLSILLLMQFLIDPELLIFLHLLHLARGHVVHPVDTA